MTKKTKMPKSLFGVKIPKILRKAGWVNDILGSEAGRKLVADTLVALASAAAAAILAYRPGRDEVVETGRSVARKAKAIKREASGDQADTVLELIPRSPRTGTRKRRGSARPRRTRASDAA
ncbi:hypothetical protein [Microvirga pudoricolor]|uniref:hypothetical protein n=1 Tax=Microvirga pudoricolor TaxID=2778729 RepID=UPI0019509803|nr:hypothetical protein [Microvirga pudoricolor]MBM6596326.1 hypothetical protein [Microvirga pudoricolor]